MLLSEMLGEKRYVPFKVRGIIFAKFRVNTYTNGVEYIEKKDEGEDDNGIWMFCARETLYEVIHGAPANIIHLPPPLSDEQRVVLMSLFTIGARYMGMTPDGWKRCFVNKPQKGANTWICGDIKDMQALSIAPKMANCLDSLVDVSDTEPFDIAKALGVGE